MDTRQKEKYSLGGGLTLHIERGFNFNRREDFPSRAEIIHGENLPSGADVLVYHNASEPSYEVFDEDFLTPEERRNGYKIFSIPTDMALVYFKDGEWFPCDNFVIAERIFKLYTGAMVGIPHEQIKNRMFITKGIHEGKVAVTTVNCDYEIIFHDRNNRPQSLIRTRHREIMAIDKGMTKQVKKGVLLIGTSASNAKPLKESINARND